MQTKTAQFTFTIPDGHPDAGNKLVKSFEHQVTDNDAEAAQVMSDKKWKLSSMVNDMLKANARSNAYQAALLPYKPSEVPQEDIKERMVRDYIRMGFSEEKARQKVEDTLAELNS